MGLLDFFEKPPVVQDDFFGSLLFMGVKNDLTKSYFEGKGRFSPVDWEIEYFIDAGLDGPTAAQRNFYRKVESLYDDLLDKCRPFLEDGLRSWVDNLQIRDIRQEFRIVGLSVPRQDANPLVWEMYFETVHNNNLGIIITFDQFEPTGIDFET